MRRPRKRTEPGVQRLRQSAQQKLRRSGACSSLGVPTADSRVACGGSRHGEGTDHSPGSPCPAPIAPGHRQFGATGHKTMAFVARHGTPTRPPSLLDTIKTTSSLTRVRARSLREPLPHPSPFLLKFPRFRHHKNRLCTPRQRRRE